MGNLGQIIVSKGFAQSAINGPIWPHWMWGLRMIDTVLQGKAISTCKLKGNILLLNRYLGMSQPVWPDWAIYCSLGKFSKPVVTIILPILGNFCEGVKLFQFYCKIILGQLL